MVRLSGRLPINGLSLRDRRVRPVRLPRLLLRPCPCARPCPRPLPCPCLCPWTPRPRPREGRAGFPGEGQRQRQGKGHGEGQGRASAASSSQPTSAGNGDTDLSPRLCLGLHRCEALPRARSSRRVSGDVGYQCKQLGADRPTGRQSLPEVRSQAEPGTEIKGRCPRPSRRSTSNCATHAGRQPTADS